MYPDRWDRYLPVVEGDEDDLKVDPDKPGPVFWLVAWVLAPAANVRIAFWVGSLHAERSEELALIAVVALIAIEALPLWWIAKLFGVTAADGRRLRRVWHGLVAIVIATFFLGVCALGAAAGG